MAKWIPTIGRVDDLAPPFGMDAPVDEGSIEGSLYTLLSGDANIGGYVSTRIYRVQIPQGAAMPAITFQQISGVRDQVMTHPTGLVESRFQINCWAKTYTETRIIANAVRKLLDGFDGMISNVTIQCIHLMDEGDMPQITAGTDVLKRHGKRLDFRIWFEESIV